MEEEPLYYRKRDGGKDMLRLLMIADDFTGALDAGVQFAACGAVTRVITGQSVQLDALVQTCEVLVVDAQTRHIGARQAYAVVKAVVEQAKGWKIPHIYKKTDSALRGNIGAELTALLDGSGEGSLPFLPAFPQMQRKTLGGIHYIDGVPVEQSVFGQDPFEPVRHSAVAALIAEQSQVETSSVPADQQGAALPESKGIWIFDGATQQDLEQTAQRLLEADKLHIMAGCAGFASVLPRLLKLGTGKPEPIPQLDPNFLVICGSVNPITLAQAERAEQAGFLRLRLAPEQKLDPQHWQTPQGQQELEQLRQELMSHPLRILDTNDKGGNQPTAQCAAQRGMDTEAVRQAVSGTIGYLVSQLFACPELGTLLVTGGDTLLQCMDYMGIHEIQPLRELDSGVVLSRFTYQGVTRYVISKSGGFGRENLFLELAERIRRS